MTKNTQPIHAPANKAGEKLNDDDKDPNVKQKPTTKTSRWVWAAMIFFAVLTYVTMPDPLQPPHGQPPSIKHVFYYGWLTAIFTGLGAVPLAFAPNLAPYWVGLSNAVAAGMMIAASYSLLYEGWTFEDPNDFSSVPVHIRTVVGAVIGLIFINVTERLLADYEDLSVGGLAGADVKRALLIFFVMTLHSFFGRSRNRS